MKSTLFISLIITLLLAFVSCDSKTENSGSGTTTGLKSTPEDAATAKKLVGKWRLDSLTITPPGTVFTQKDMGELSLSFSAEGKMNITKPDTQNPANQEESVADFSVAENTIITSDMELAIISVSQDRLCFEAGVEGKGSARYVYKRK